MCGWNGGFSLCGGGTTRQKIEEWRVEHGEQKFEQILADDGGDERRPHVGLPKPAESDAERNADEQDGIEYLAGHCAGVVPNPSCGRGAVTFVKIPVTDSVEEPDIPQL